MLYRKVNTKARGVKHLHGKDYSDERSKSFLNNTKCESMHGEKQRGLDYTPLFKYLISKVGNNWDEIYHDIKNRIDKDDPIYWIVARNEKDKEEIVRLGESTYFSGLYIDENNNLQIVNPDLRNENLQPMCPCCTHTFNGLIFVNKYQPSDNDSYEIRKLIREKT